MRKLVLAGIIAGILVMLPLGPLSLPFLLFFPGFCVYAHMKRQVSIVELTAASITLSLLIVPVVSVITRLLDLDIMRTVLGLFIIATICLSNEEFKVQPRRQDGIVILLAIIAAMVVFLPLLGCFTFTGDGLAANPTHAADLNYHLSIIQRYINAPQIPVEDPYLPGYHISYNWFMHVFMGDMCRLTEMHPFSMLKIVFPMLIFALFLNMYLLSRYVFDEGSAVCSSLIYVFTGGLSWLYIAMHHEQVNLFRALTYNFGDMVMLKYDPTLLFYLMPQTQAFALVLMVFVLYLWVVSTAEVSRRMAALTGISLGILVYYHIISAFPLFVLVALHMLLDRKKLEVNAIILASASIIAAFQLVIFPQNALSHALSQVVIARHPNILLSTILALGILVPFGILGALKLRRSYNEKAQGILIFGAVLFVILNTITLPLTQNTYRFLVYLTIPASIFSGYFVYDSYKRASSLKKYLPLLAISLILPSTIMLGGFYMNSDYIHVDDSEIQALNWIYDNVPHDAIFLEEPSHFPRIPLLTGRRIAYAGQLYMMQYHGVDGWADVNRLFYEGDPSRLNDDLHARDVSYVFVGHREAKYPLDDTLRDTDHFEKVYDHGGVRIYRVI